MRFEDSVWWNKLGRRNKQFIKKKMMKGLVSCYGEQAVQVADCSSSSSSSRLAFKSKSGRDGSMSSMPCYGSSNSKMVSSIYSLLICGCPLLVRVSWCKGYGGEGLLVEVSDLESSPPEMKDRPFWRKKSGLRRLEHGGWSLDAFWDLTKAKYGPGPEPVEGYHINVVSVDERETVLHIGDDVSTLGNIRNGVMIGRKEYVSGRGFYHSKTQFCRDGPWHDVAVECHQEDGGLHRLKISVDKDVVLQVRHLVWKFRGNETIAVDGIDVEILWDVHGWFFNSCHGEEHNGVFMFRTSGQCLGFEKSMPGSRGGSFEDKEFSQGFSFVLHACKND